MASLPPRLGRFLCPLFLLFLSVWKTHADCAIRDIGLDSDVNAEEDCGLVAMKNGQSCTLLPQRCGYSKTIVRSFTCNGDDWVWTSPPVYCEPFQQFCEWSVITNTLLCDYSRASGQVTTPEKGLLLDRRLEVISFLSFPRPFNFDRNSFLGLESRLRILTIRSQTNLDADAGTFVGLSQLVRLDLSNNSLTNINVYTLPPLGRLEYLDLRGNPELAAKAGTDPYALHAAMESCWPKTAPQSRTLLMDDAACDIEIKDGVDPALECAVVVCKKPSATLIPCPPLRNGSTVGDGLNATLISPAQLCNRVSDCPASSDEQVSICGEKTVAATMLDPTSSPLCASLEDMFGPRFLYTSGLAVMTLENSVTYLYRALSILIWQRLSPTTAELNANPGGNSEVTDVESQLLSASDNATLKINMTLVIENLGPQDLMCIFIFPFAEDTPTSTSTTTTITLGPPEEARASSSGLQPAVAAGIGAAGAALLAAAIIVICVVRRRTNAASKHASEVMEMHVLQRAQERARGVFARDYGRAIQDIQRLEMSFNLKMLPREDIVLLERDVHWTAQTHAAHQVWRARLKTAAGSESNAYMKTDTGMFTPNALYEHKHRKAAAGTLVQAKVCGQSAQDFEAKTALLVEARLLHCLSRHPHILSLVAVAAVGEPLMIVTPHMEGGPLSYYLRHSQSELNHVACGVMCKGIASAMAYLESLSIVHRGLSLDAVVVGSGPDDVKLAGFGAYDDRGATAAAVLGH